MRFQTSRPRGRVLVAAAVTIIAGAVPAVALGGDTQQSRASADLSRINHIVVIYEENHSFDNLYGGWEGVNGLAQADAAHTTQVSQAGTAFSCLLQNDVNLTSPSPLPATCSDTTTATPFSSAFVNAPFAIDDFIKPTDTTCPAPGVFAAHGVAKGSGQPGGCTEDLVHRYYQEQYQLNGGAQNRYVTGSDAIGLSMGYYNTSALPVYGYLHQDDHPHYAIADNFFESAFGGSFLNHQWLISAHTPTWPGADNSGGLNDLHSVVDANGMPTSSALYKSPAAAGHLRDTALTASCDPPPGRDATPDDVTCGDFAVNTIQPPYQPYAPGTPAAKRLPPQTAPTIGDRLSDAGVDWSWYSGGWSNANGDVNGPGWTNGAVAAAPNSSGGTCPDAAANAKAIWPNCPDKLFQYHHQAFNYYANYAPGTAARAAHVRDEQEFLQLANGSTDSCNLKPVSFVKPIGAENEHPGYTGESVGSDHLVALLKAIESGRCAKDTMVVATYDEFGGSWDHVPPPGQGSDTGPHDKWGPGTRIPALVISPFLRGDFVVDHTQYDTTSLLSTIEDRYGLAPLGTRDAAVNDLSQVFTAKSPSDGSAG